MARSKQTARKSTGGAAPRKAAPVAKRTRAGMSKSPEAKKKRAYESSDDGKEDLPAQRRTILNPFTDEVIVFLPEKKKVKASPMNYVNNEFGEEIQEYKSSFDAIFKMYTSGEDRKKVQKKGTEDKNGGNGFSKPTTKPMILATNPLASTPFTSNKDLSNQLLQSGGSQMGGFNNFGGAGGLGGASKPSPGFQKSPSVAGKTIGGFNFAGKTITINESAKKGSNTMTRRQKAMDVDDDTDGLWQWEDDHGGYTNYDEVTTNMIEAAHANGDTTCTLSHGFFGQGGGNYTIDFTNMSQTKSSTGYVRQIKRNDNNQSSTKKPVLNKKKNANINSSDSENSDFQMGDGDGDSDDSWTPSGDVS